ncbi:MAG: SDR family NAD(P)-dependent oxidoreductase, partial [Spirochaetes bacterium]|nr:SDR family NAD(P)-dependent oxidoreductase [Spirochaetota bacterium]
VMPFTGPYSMSKRALEAYADSLRRELQSLGIRVSVIQPGAFRTTLLARAREHSIAEPPPHLSPPPSIGRGTCSGGNQKRGWPPTRSHAA